MNRLRVRVELNRRKTGVPMEELVSVVEETRKFFHLLAEDVQIPADRGEWLASNFDPESLNFTAEFDGPASTEQIRAFGSAFGGATSLRRETIAQFTHIADFIGEDELVGFGLYQSDQENEPSDWRCLSRRDALRFADEIQLLAKAAGEYETDSPLPAVNGTVGGRRLFKDRREREALTTDPSRWIREVESSLSKRIALLEGEVEAYQHKMKGLSHAQNAADERFQRLLGAMDSYWNQAPRQLLAGTPQEIAHELASLGDGTSTVAETPLGRTVLPERSQGSGHGWKLGLAIAAAALIVIATQSSEIGRWLRSPKAASPSQITKITTTGQPGTVANGSDPGPAASEKTVVPDAAPTLTDSKAIESLAPIPTKRPQPESGAGAARRDTSVEMDRQISLEIPAVLRSFITEPVLINVTVSIDQKGKVTAAEVASTKGEGAGLLTTEALKAARWFHFRPMRQGNKAVASETVLTFVFDPDTRTVPPEGPTPGN